MFDQLQNYRLPDATSDGHHRICQMFSFVCVGFNSIHSFVAVVGMTHLSRELSMSCPAEANQVVHGLHMLFFVP